jgi:hypothetical protein
LFEAIRAHAPRVRPELERDLAKLAGSFWRIRKVDLIGGKFRMCARRWIACVALALLALTLAGCGSHFRHVDPAAFPLARGFTITNSEDDPPADAEHSRNYDLWLVITGPRGTPSDVLRVKQLAQLKSDGWIVRGSGPDFRTGDSGAAHVSFALTTVDDAQREYFAQRFPMPSRIIRKVAQLRASHSPALVVSLVRTD